MVASRRIEERSKKAQKGVGSKQFSTAESVITKLLRDSGIEQSGTRIEAWIEQDSAFEVCRSWLRAERCSHKKCKFVHDSNIAHLRNLTFSEIDDQPTELLSTGPYELCSIAKRDFIKLRFLAVGGLCVYDYQYPQVWTSWYTPRIQIERTEADKPVKLSIIKETSEEHALMDDMEGVSSVKDLSMSPSGVSSKSLHSAVCANFADFFLDFDHQAIVPFANVFSNLIPFLNMSDLVRVATASKALLQQSNKVDLYRLLRKECLTSLTVERSKAKKIEKKKKIKQANVKKASKKDAFARGGNS